MGHLIKDSSNGYKLVELTRQETRELSDHLEDIRKDRRIKVLNDRIRKVKPSHKKKAKK